MRTAKLAVLLVLLASFAVLPGCNQAERQQVADAIAMANQIIADTQPQRDELAAQLTAVEGALLTLPEGPLRDKLVQARTDILTQLAKAETILQKAQAALPTLEKALRDADSTFGAVLGVAEAVRDAAPRPVSDWAGLAVTILGIIGAIYGVKKGKAASAAETEAENAEAEAQTNMTAVKALIEGVKQVLSGLTPDAAEAAKATLASAQRAAGSKTLVERLLGKA